jgi:hypothetical protein
MDRMSSSDSIDDPSDPSDPSGSSGSSGSADQAGLDPAIAEAVDGVTNRFGAEGLEQMIAYAETSLADARAALRQLADAVGES